MSNKHLIRTQRILGYILFLFAAIQLITGFTMVGILGFIPASLANTFHRMYILIPLAFLASAHSFIGFRMALYRKKIKSKWLDIILIIIAVAIIAAVTVLVFL